MGTGTFTPDPLAPPALRAAGRRTVVVPPGRAEPDVPLVRDVAREVVLARDGRARDVVEPEVRALDVVPDVLRAVADVPAALALEALDLEVFEPVALVPVALVPVALVPVALVLVALVPVALVPEVLAPEVVALELRELEVLALELLTRDIPAPEVLVPEVPELRDPALLARATVLRAADVALVATLPASAIPAHPPVHMPERVVRLSPRCFRYRGVPSVARRIQTDLFPGHGGTMGTTGREYLTDGYDHDTPCPRYPTSPRVRIRLLRGTDPGGPKNR